MKMTWRDGMRCDVCMNVCMYVYVCIQWCYDVIQINNATISWQGSTVEAAVCKHMLSQCITRVNKLLQLLYRIFYCVRNDGVCMMQLVRMYAANMQKNECRQCSVNEGMFVCKRDAKTKWMTENNAQKTTVFECTQRNCMKKQITQRKLYTERQRDSYRHCTEKSSAFAKRLNDKFVTQQRSSTRSSVKSTVLY